MIKWYQILEKKILNIISCKKNNIYNDDIIFNEKSAFSISNIYSFAKFEI